MTNPTKHPAAVPLLVAVAATLAALAIALSGPSGCATAGQAVPEVAAACAGPVAPAVVSLVRSAALESADAALPAVLGALRDCVAHLAAEAAERELASLGGARVAAAEPGSPAGVGADVARARIAAWLAEHPAAGGGPVKAGLPGGGNGIPFCCFHPGTSTLWKVGEFCGGTLLTAANISSICASGACPERRVCSTGH